MKKIPREIRVCACGECGETFECKVNSKQRFIHGHNRGNKHHSKKSREKMSISTTGKSKSKEHRRKIGKTLKGRKKSKVSDVKRIKTRKNNGKPWHSKEAIEKIRKGNVQTQNRPGYKERQRVSTTKQWQDPEYVSKQMIARGIKPNKSEKLLDELFQQLLPNRIKYIGDGKDEDSIIAGKCPDFIFTDGQKKIIEFFGDFWHGEGRTGVPNEQHEQERIDLFAKEGYQTLIIWEHELKNLDKVKRNVLQFNCKGKENE
jgi:hypothetical protein